jgi:rubrerythrin
MGLDLKSERGVPLEEQEFDWKELAGLPYSKLDADAFSRVRVILMNGIESEALRFQHAMARSNDGELRRALARVRRSEQHQQTLVNWLNPADQSPLETTIGYEQVAIEVTAHLAQHEPDPYLAQVYRFGLLEDFDHMYRYAALLDRLEGKDANAILQGYTDVMPGRPTVDEHRHPDDDLRDPYDRKTAEPLTKLNALTLVAGEHQTHDYYMHVGPIYADPVARQLYAEIASIEEQHVTQYESLADPSETWLEKWLLHEATEIWNYWSCLQDEGDPRLKAIWQRFVDYELGHLHFVRELFERHEARDPWAVIPTRLPDPIRYESHREFVRETLAREVDLRASGTRFVPREDEGPASLAYRSRINAGGSPSETVAKGWTWRPGGELFVPASAATH